MLIIILNSISTDHCIVSLSSLVVGTLTMHSYRLSTHLACTGTIRSNLDPFNKYDDAKLWDALRRACLSDLVSSNGQSPESSTSRMASNMNRYTLDTVIESEGANLSIGERSLLSLGRALVKDCKVVILDEAT